MAYPHRCPTPDIKIITENRREPGWLCLFLIETKTVNKKVYDKDYRK
jgi:hypothetical protein